jgi:biopolymer transport protein ExbB/TolQ
MKLSVLIWDIFSWAFLISFLILGIWLDYISIKIALMVVGITAICLVIRKIMEIYLARRKLNRAKEIKRINELKRQQIKRIRESK